MRYVVGLSLCIVAVEASALADEAALDEAEQLLETGEFERAMETLARIAESDVDLGRRDLERLLTLRAVAAGALGREADVERDLYALASILDGREPSGLPPNLERRFEAVRTDVAGPVRVQVTIEPDPDGDLIARLAVLADPGSLTRDTELVCSSDAIELARGSGRRLSIPRRAHVSCHGEARGPGGATIATGNATRSSGGTSVFETEPWPWILIGAGAAVVLGIVIGIAIAATASGGITGPMWIPTEM